MTEPTAPTAIEPVIDRLDTITRDLLGYLELRATEIAAPRIAEAQHAASEEVREANAQLQRQQDLVAELRRQLEASDRYVDRLRAQQTVSAAAVDERPGGRR